MRIRSHIRNNIIGYIALFFALCGVAYAGDGPLAGQNTVGSDDIIDGEVFNKDVHLNTIASGRVHDDTLTANDLAQHSVGFSELDPSDFASSDIAANCRTLGVCRYEIPANAIQTGEIQDGQVTSSDIQNGQVTKADLASNAAPDGYSAFDDDTGIICNASCTEGSLKNLPAGSYAISAKIVIDQNSNDAQLFARCELDAGADFDNGWVGSAVDGAPHADDYETIAMQVVHTYGSNGGAASVNCYDLNIGDSTGRYLKITAIRLGSLSNVHSTSASNR
jgi:hypothetical protein